TQPAFEKFPLGADLIVVGTLRFRVRRILAGRARRAVVAGAIVVRKAAGAGRLCGDAPGRVNAAGRRRLEDETKFAGEQRVTGLKGNDRSGRTVLDVVGCLVPLETGAPGGLPALAESHGIMRIERSRIDP